MLGEPPVRQLAQVSLHLTEYVRLFGEYSGHELADEPDAYGPYLISISPRSASMARPPVDSAVAA
ncbi:MAG: hypothetical protein V7643_4891 [Mycobacterium sp.]|jgi:hypothetical protein